MRWALIGCGWLARDYVAPHLPDLVACVDRDPARARALCPDAAVDTLEALFAREPEAVYVATPNHTHPELVRACAAHGVAVLCEKPMATTYAAARGMVEACREAGVQYATAHNQRFHPAHVALRETDLGEVLQARVHYACTAPAWWGPSDWHWDRERAGGGAVFDLAPHGLDLIGTLTGRRLLQATAMVQRDEPVEAGGVVLGRWEGDLLGVVQVSYETPETYPRRRLELVGTSAMAIAEDTMGQEPGGRVTLVDAATGERSELAFDRTASPFAAELRAFEAAVEGTAPWPYDVDQDLSVMAALEAAVPAPDPHAPRVSRPSVAQDAADGDGRPPRRTGRFDRDVPRAPVPPEELPDLSGLHDRGPLREARSLARFGLQPADG